MRLLISCWENTHPLTFNFVWSLRSLCMEQVDCSLEAVSFESDGFKRDENAAFITCPRFTCRSSSTPECRGTAVSGGSTTTGSW